MRFENAYLPARGYWSSPFCRWQGSFASVHPVGLAADVTKQALDARGIEASACDSLVLGWTVPSRGSFYGGPWLGGLIGAPHITGATISQACATSVAALAYAAAQIDAGSGSATLVITTDKCSNGPHVYYPEPDGPGGKGEAEDWVWDNFSFDPWARNSMIQTAENVANEAGITREEMDALTLRRYDQYQDAVDSRFFERYMVVPYDVNPSGKKVIATVDGDEGIFPTTKEGLERLEPVLPEGTVTYGTQTHPADGTAGMVVATKDRAKAWSGDAEPVRLISTGTARAEKGYMAKAVVPAAQRALDAAGIGVKDCAVIKTHNPFAVNDIYLARELGVEAEWFNNYGSSLVFGHPQGPTGARLIAEGIEEARIKDGGYVLFTGCAAGDTAAAAVLQV